MDKESLG